jgi:hypothetical protein
MVHCQAHRLIAAHAVSTRRCLRLPCDQVRSGVKRTIGFPRPLRVCTPDRSPPPSMGMMTARLGEGDIGDDISPAARRITYAKFAEAREETTGLDARQQWGLWRGARRWR